MTAILKLSKAGLSAPADFTKFGMLPSRRREESDFPERRVIALDPNFLLWVSQISTTRAGK